MGSKNLLGIAVRGSRCAAVADPGKIKAAVKAAMQVCVTLYTILRKYGSGKVGPDGLLELHENASLQDLCHRLAIPPRMGRVFLVNGSPRREGWVLNPGDEVRVFAFIGGG